MNTIIRLARALAYLMDRNGIEVHEFPNNSYQVVVRGDVYCYDQELGWHRPDGEYAPGKTLKELQERLNLAIIHVANVKAGHTTPEAEPKPKAKAHKAHRTTGTPTKGNCIRCNGSGKYTKPSAYGPDCWNCDGTGTYIKGRGKRLKS